ncbi:MAG: hypothetical protein KF836_08285 [Fimbriimonadaceae bacterium]|nr:hypothetical protein [Fimbriimonadaceae bacterium]
MKNRTFWYTSILVGGLLSWLLLVGCYQKNQKQQGLENVEQTFNELYEMKWYAPTLSELEKRIVEYRYLNQSWPKNISDLVHGELPYFPNGNRGSSPLGHIREDEMSLVLVKSTPENALFSLTLRGIKKQLSVNLKDHQR